MRYEDYKLLTDEEKGRYNVYPKLNVYNVFNIEQTNMREVYPELYEKIREEHELKRPEQQGEDFSFAAIDEMIAYNEWLYPIALMYQDKGEAPVLVAEMRHPKSGRTLQTYTTQPGLCFFTAKWLNFKHHTAHGIPYGNSWGACFETQHHPDSPNHPNFPSTVLRPDDIYHEVTIYKVGLCE